VQPLAAATRAALRAGREALESLSGGGGRKGEAPSLLPRGSASANSRFHDKTQYGAAGVAAPLRQPPTPRPGLERGPGSPDRFRWNATQQGKSLHFGEESIAFSAHHSTLKTVRREQEAGHGRLPAGAARLSRAAVEVSRLRLVTSEAGVEVPSWLAAEEKAAKAAAVAGGDAAAKRPGAEVAGKEEDDRRPVEEDDEFDRADAYHDAAGRAAEGAGWRGHASGEARASLATHSLASWETPGVTHTRWLRNWDGRTEAKVTRGWSAPAGWSPLESRSPLHTEGSMYCEVARRPRGQVPAMHPAVYVLAAAVQAMEREWEDGNARVRRSMTRGAIAGLLRPRLPR